MKKRSTIKDVAEYANVSKATVSHVLNGTRHVEPETKARVLGAIEVLNYRRSIVARGLATNRTQTIGVIVADASDNFFGEILRGLSTVLGDVDYNMIVCETEQKLDREEHYLKLLLSQQVDGIIAMATSQRWDALSVADVKGLPLVFVDRSFDGLDRPFVCVNNYHSAYIGTEHMINCGCKKIGILAGFQRLSTMRERLSGFRQALADHNLALPPEWVVTSLLSIEDGRKAAHDILSLPNPPEALFINNAFLSLGTLLALKDMGLHCPEDVALVGFDDHPWAAVANPPLTVIHQPSHEIGSLSAQIMLDLINGQEPAKMKYVLDCELIIRQSCKCSFA